MKCSVRNCDSTSSTDRKTVSFFQLPKSSKIAKKWLLFCDNPQLKNRKSTFVCSDHFRPEDIGGGGALGTAMCRRRLRLGAMPCIRKSDSVPSKERIKAREQCSSERLENDLLASSKVTETTSEPQDNEVIQETNCETQALSESLLSAKPKPDKNFDKLDTESSEAVIDELSNQVKDLRLENFRLQVNIKLAQRNYKAEIKKLKNKLEQARSQILQLEMQLEDNK
ncbi:uncharacterized protein Dvir_GJ26348 [Drosophila virilis]|uniref:THAP-type domain-containing protein n=1 Tax=Drosophila virilis TaxID=7244 RepID=A0A0Q9WI31_DROVI|nr:uncharacterized protein LOC26531118 [Drosophila virilis]KRF81815.1 uncharacterized protein Dvir_GJ26348 [Drosophila virilis]